MILETLPKERENEFDSDSLVYINDIEMNYNRDFDRDIIEDIKNREMQIYGGYYRYEKGWKSPNIFLLGRGKKSGKFKFKVQGFRPYCYENAEDGEYKTYLG